jgi:hypothetical protein
MKKFVGTPTYYLCAPVSLVGHHVRGVGMSKIRVTCKLPHLPNQELVVYTMAKEFDVMPRIVWAKVTKNGCRIQAGARGL